MKKTGILLIGIVAVFVMSSFLNAAQPGQPDDDLIGTAIGNQAPELAFESPDGDIIKLSSLRGQMVLIDFWAAWCPPCRKENPNLVQAYRKYKDASFQNGDGFTIYSVSLDRSEKSWVQAIEDDELESDYHISPLKYRNSQGAAIYGVRSIPSNFLIDGDGIIIAKNLRGPFLESTLEKFIK